MSPSSPLFLSPFFCPPFALPYIVLAISQSTNGSYSSIIGGDPGPLGDRGWKLSECRKAFYLFLSLFSSVSLMFPFPRSVFLSLPLPPPLSLCLQRLLWKLPVYWTVHVALPIAAYANRIINYADDYTFSLTHLHLHSLHTLHSVPAHTVPVLAGRLQRRGCRREAWGLWYKDVLSAWVYSSHSALR